MIDMRFHVYCEQPIGGEGEKRGKKGGKQTQRHQCTESGAWR